MLERKAGTRANLDFIALGNGDREAGRHRVALALSEGYVFGSDHIEPRRMFSRPRRQGKAFAMRQALKLDVDQLSLPSVLIQPDL
jgi:hypothetical protein